MPLKHRDRLPSLIRFRFYFTKRVRFFVRSRSGSFIKVSPLDGASADPEEQVDLLDYRVEFIFDFFAKRVRFFVRSRSGSFIKVSPLDGASADPEEQVDLLDYRVEFAFDLFHKTCTIFRSFPQRLVHRSVVARWRFGRS